MPKGSDDLGKQLKIKHGVCKRCVPLRRASRAHPYASESSRSRRMIKEAAYYKKEAVQNEERVQKMKDDGVDQWTVKKAEEVLGESYMMIPDSEKRMKASIEDLFAFVQENGEDADVKESKEYEPVQALLEEHDALLEG